MGPRDAYRNGHDRNEALADRLKNGSPVQDAREPGIPCVINTVDDSRRLRTGDQLTADATRFPAPCLLAIASDDKPT